MFSDVNKSGHVSPDEVGEILDLIQEIVSGSEVDPIKVGQGIYRILDPDRDENGKDVIGLQKIYKFFSDIIDLLSTFATNVLKHLRKSFMDKQLKESMLSFCCQILEPQIPSIYPVAEIIGKIGEGYSGQDLKVVLHNIAECWIQISSIPAFKCITSAACAYAHEFFACVSSASVNGTLDICELRNRGSTCVSSIIASLVKDTDPLQVRDELEALFMDQLHEAVQVLSHIHMGEEIFKEKRIDSGSVKLRLEVITVKNSSKKIVRCVETPLIHFKSILYSAVRAIYNQLTEIGVKNIVNATLRLLDPKQVGHVALSDLELLWNLVLEMFEKYEDDDDYELKERFEQILECFLLLSRNKTMDHDSGSTVEAFLDYEGFVACAEAVLNIGFTVSEELIALLKNLSLEVAKPILDLAMLIKSQVLLSDRTVLTYDDIHTLKKIFESD